MKFELKKHCRLLFEELVLIGEGKAALTTQVDYDGMAIFIISFLCPFFCFILFIFKCRGRDKAERVIPEV